MPFVPDPETKGRFVPDNATSESGPMSFLRAMGNQMPLGNQFSALVSPGPYSSNLEAIKNTTQQDKAVHPIAYGSGAVTGAVAPALIPGVGEAMAANPMTTGALFGGTNAVSDTDIQKQPLQAAAQAGTGAVTGSLLSGLLGKILPNQQSLEERANKLANRSINMPTGVLGGMTAEERQAQGSFLRSSGLVGRDKEEIKVRAEKLFDDFGKQIGKVADTAEGQGLTVDSVEHDQAITNLLSKAQAFKGSVNREAKTLSRDYTAGATDIANLPDNPNWSAVQKLKEQYGTLAFKPSGEIKSEGAKDTYFALKDMLKSIADRAQGDPNLGAKYKNALSGYSRMSPIVSGLEKEVDSELRGGTPHMGVHIPKLVAGLPGPLRATIGVGALGMGHPMLAAAAALPEIMSPALQSDALSGLASASPILQGGIEQAATKAVTNPEQQANVVDLLRKLTQKFGKPESNRK